MRKCYTLLVALLLVSGTAFGQSPPRLIINEFLADPATDVALGDADGDGVRGSASDEFVELANRSRRDTLDLTGWRVGDDEKVNFTFPDGYKLPPGALVVIFGGSDATHVTGYDPDPLKTRVFATADSVGNGLSNSGESIVLLSPDGTQDLYLSYGSQVGKGAPATPALGGATFEYAYELPDAIYAKDASVVRSPDGNTLDANPFVLHSDVSTARFSPGTTLDGQTALPRQVPPLTVIINEVLSDPPAGEAGDANRDGTRGDAADEYVELANVSDQPVDLSGWTLGDDEKFVTFTFPQGYTLQPRSLVTVFGGGDVSNVTGYDPDPLKTRVFVADSTHLGSIGNALANGGEAIFLLSDDGSYDTYLTYGSRVVPGPAAMPEGVEFEFEVTTAVPGNADASMTRFPDGNVNVADPFVLHGSVAATPYSANTTVDGKELLPAPTPPITVVINEVLAEVDTADANNDGMAEVDQDQFIELVNTSKTEAVDLSGWRLGDNAALTFTFPQGYVLQPQAFVAVFGGGDVSNAPGYNADPLQTRVFAASGALGDGLDVTGDYAVLVSDDDVYDSYVAWGSKSGAGDPVLADAPSTDWEFGLNTAATAAPGVSITRDPDGYILAPDPFVAHTATGELPYSPARTAAGLDDLDDFVDVPYPFTAGNAMHFKWYERDRVVVEHAAEIMPMQLDEGTIEMWFRPDSVLTHNTHDPDFTYLFSKNLSGNVLGDLGIGWERGEGRLSAFMQEPGKTTSTVYSSDESTEVFYPRWYHLAVTWNAADSMRMFIDGKLVDVVKTDIPLYGGTQPIAIGNGSTDLFNDRYEGFRGMIDDVRFSIVERYKDNFQVPTEPYQVDEFTLALWNFDEADGDVAVDVTGNGFDGKLGGVNKEGQDDPLAKPTRIPAATLVAVEDGGKELPTSFGLEQNYPNPFNPNTAIQFSVPQAARVELSVYNLLGQKVEMLVDQQMTTGTYRVDFDGSRFASGVYFYVLRSGNVSLVRKMVLLK